MVLATAPVAVVKRSVSRARQRRPGSEVVVAAAGIDGWRFEGNGLSVWTTGEGRLDLDDPDFRDRVRREDITELVIPLSVPRHAQLSTVRFVRALADLRVRAELGGQVVLPSRAATIAVLVAATLVVYTPIDLALRVAAFVDGIGLLAALVLAREEKRRTRRREHWSGPVCHVITNLGTGGAQRQLVLYLRASVGEGNTPRVIALWEHDELYQLELETLGVEVEVIARTLRRSWVGVIIGRALPHLSTLVLLAWRMRRLQPRSVMCWLFLANLIGPGSARLAGVCRVVTSVRNLSAWKTWSTYRRWWFRSAERLAAALVDVIVANADAVAEDFVAWSGCSGDRVRVVSNGVDVDGLEGAPWRDLRPQLDKGSGSPIVLSIGRLATEKDHAALLRASADLAQRGVHHRLVLAGHGELEGELRELARTLGIDDYVVFFGKSTDPQSLYRSCDVFALTSRIEGMPNVLLEAQALGVPVVTVAAGGAGEVVADGETGLVVEVGDERALGAALERLLADGDLRRRMSVAAVARMRAEFPPDRLVSAIDELTGRRAEPGGE